MIYPSIAELTNNNKINRYTLVVATAKCARVITDECVKQKEYAAKIALSKDTDKKSTVTSVAKREIKDEKAVKSAIAGLYTGEFQLVKLDGTRELIGRGAELAEQAVEAEAEINE